MFTTLLVVDGRPVALAAHIARLGASVWELYGRPLPGDAEDRATAAAAGLRTGRLRLTYSPGSEAGSVEAVAAEIDPATVLPGWAGALDLRSTRLSSWDGSHKWADRGLLESLERAAAPAAPLLVATDGHVRETSRASLFAVVRGRLITPPAGGDLLPGVARAAVLELAAAAGLTAAQEPLTLADLASASEAFATNAIRLLQPIRSLDGSPIPGPGPVTESLTTRLRERWLPTWPA